jgi:hypothetical protein
VVIGELNPRWSTAKARYALLQQRGQQGRVVVSLEAFHQLSTVKLRTKAAISDFETINGDQRHGEAGSHRQSLVIVIIPHYNMLERNTTRSARSGLSMTLGRHPHRQLLLDDDFGRWQVAHAVGTSKQILDANSVCVRDSTHFVTSTQ